VLIGTQEVALSYKKLVTPALVNKNANSYLTIFITLCWVW